MATAAASIAIQYCNASLRSEDRMDVGGRAVLQEGRCCPLRLRRPCSRSAAVSKRSPTIGAVLAISPAPRTTTGSIASSTSVFTDPFAAPRFVIRADPPRRATHEQGKADEGGRGEQHVSPEKLDEWLRESVCEIVRNIGEAPFLVHVFSSNEGPAGLRLEREPADDAESWPRIRGRWSTGAAFPPDGVILVEELREGGEDQDGKRGGDEVSARSWDVDHGDAASSSSSKTWGVLVQGRGADGGAAASCYILNTCRVRSSFGFCTHFCLARAKCFGDTADVQLRKAWLLGRREHQHQQH